MPTRRLILAASGVMLQSQQAQAAAPTPGGYSAAGATGIEGELSVMAVGPLSSIMNVNVPLGIKRILTSGRFAANDNAAAFYRVLEPGATSLLPSEYQTVTANGRVVVYDHDSDPRGVNAFACIGPGVVLDAVIDGYGRYVSGTDTTAGLQSAIRYAVYFAKRKCYVPAVGVTNVGYITDTLQLGDGVTYVTGVLEFDGYKYGGRASFAGVALVCTFSDRPLINIQGGRGSEVIRPTMMGPLQYHIERNGAFLYNYAGGIGDDTIAETSIDPAAAPTANSQFAPFGAITIDAYSGPRPATGYPPVHYPAWLSERFNRAQPITPYGKLHSSQTRIERPFCQGFVAMVISAPCDADGNGDYLVIDGGNFSYCIYGVSICNSQARNSMIRDLAGGIYHTAFVNDKHGRRSGNFQGEIQNFSGGEAIYLFDFGSNVVGPVRFTAPYVEAQWSIGIFNSNEILTIHDGEFSMFSNPPSRGVPRFMIAGGGAACISLADTQISGGYTTYMMGGQISYYEASNLWTGGRGLTTRQCYQALAQNLLSGGVCFQPSASVQLPTRYSCTQVVKNNCQTAATTAGFKTGDRVPVSRTFPLPAWVPSASPTGMAGYSVQAPAIWTQISQGNFGSPSLSGTTLTLGCPPGWTANQMNAAGMMPGDVILSLDGDVVFIWSNTGPGGVIKAELQNNFKGGSGNFGQGEGAVPIAPISLTGRTWFFGNSRFFQLTYPMLMDVVAGENGLSNTGTDNGISAHVAGDLKVGDLLHVNPILDNWLPLAARAVTSVGAGGTSVTLSGKVNAGKSMARKVQNWFIQAPPPNAAAA